MLFEVSSYIWHVPMQMKPSVSVSNNKSEEMETIYQKSPKTKRLGDQDAETGFH